jgi:UDP-N-acetylglucosamine 3-dehydrogenase
MSAGDLRGAVIGLGMMGANHARVLNELSGVELVGVADLDPAAVGRATDGRTARGYATVEELLAAEHPDLVVVAVPTSLHLSAVLEVLAAGSHVLVEKPIAADRAEAEQMIAAAEAADRILTVGHIERFNPAIRELSRRLDDGEIGRVFQIRAARLGPFPARVRDVGVVVDLAPHDIDVMRYLLRAEPIRLYAETEQRIHTDHEDLFTGLIKFDSGAIGLLEINWLTPTKVRKLTVTGERGMYEADYLTQDLVFYANPDKELVTEGEMTRRAVQRREPLAVELSEFVAAVRDGGPPPVAPHDALVAMLLARAMVDAAARGAVIGAEELAGVIA